jgi:phosphatidylglycerol---prolipoprotein diacylglyceryl transferase
MPPEGITIGSYMLRFYGILIVLGAVAATWLAARQIRRKAYDTIGKNAPDRLDENETDEAYEARVEAAVETESNRLSEMAWDIMPWALLGGVLGARIWHIILPPSSMVEQGITTMFYLTHPLDALSIWKGGLGIPGAVIGGFIAVWLYCRNKDIPIGYWADAIAPGLALAQAVGRWGNFFNQELYGAPTDLPWKLFIAPPYRLGKYLDVAYYHPLFLYESLWNLANMGLLLWLGRRYEDKLKTWDLFLVYLIFYGVGRFMLEFLRLDPAPLGILNANQTIMGGVAVVAAVLLVINRRKSARNL